MFNLDATDVGPWIRVVENHAPTVFGSSEIPPPVRQENSLTERFVSLTNSPGCNAVSAGTARIYA
ncbi:MAG: hypothetical protein ABWZ08_12090 [Pseudoxanthomonas sp.]